MPKHKNVNLGQGPNQIRIKVIGMLKVQVQATSPKCFRAKKEIPNNYKVLCTSVECSAQSCKLHTEITHKSDNRDKGMTIRRTTSILLSTGVECQGRALITNKFHNQIILVAVELVMEMKNLNHTNEY